MGCCINGGIPIIAIIIAVCASMLPPAGPKKAGSSGLHAEGSASSKASCVLVRGKSIGVCCRQAASPRTALLCQSRCPISSVTVSSSSLPVSFSSSTASDATDSRLHPGGAVVVRARRMRVGASSTEMNVFLTSQVWPSLTLLGVCLAPVSTVVPLAHSRASSICRNASITDRTGIFTASTTLTKCVPAESTLPSNVTESQPAAFNVNDVNATMARIWRTITPARELGRT
mmetsp:Transcript_111972/g.321752  ORF Transcript_111972/g.321752 Transcript_111972/m.321752 type:complete len:230 (-) Transcript_111972:2-691(-)